MKTVTASTLEPSVGVKARRLRISQLLTQQELANLAGVSLEEVDLFEHNLPVRLDARRKLLKELWSAQNALCQTFPR